MSHFLEVASGEEAVKAWRRLTNLCRRTDDVLGEVHALTEMSEMSETSFAEISNAANRLNAILAVQRAVLRRDEEEILVRRLAKVMEDQVERANATDLSRLAWLHLHLKNTATARKYVDRGLELDSTNEYCQRLLARLLRGD